MGRDRTSLRLSSKSAPGRPGGQCTIRGGAPFLTDLDPALDAACAARWNAAVLADPARRWQAERDLAFWRDQAGGYDARQVPTPRTMEALGASLQPDWTLLDVGAGTGRFAVPLAERVRSVTALDHSAAMLDILRSKVPPGHPVHPVCGALENAPLAPHDAVLVAWALYRCTDLEATLRRLLDLTRQGLLIVEDDGEGSPHRRFRRQGRAPGLPRATVIAGALRHLGRPVHVLRVQEERRVTVADEMDLLTRFGPPGPDPDARQRFLNALAPYLQYTADGLTYRWPFTVAVLHVSP